MSEKELNSIQELIERKILLAEVSGGLTSSDKKFINLWNYAIELQNNWNELKEYCKNNYYGTTTVGVLERMQELEGKNE